MIQLDPFFSMLGDSGSGDVFFLGMGCPAAEVCEDSSGQLAQGAAVP